MPFGNFSIKWYHITTAYPKTSNRNPTIMSLKLFSTLFTVIKYVTFISLAFHGPSENTAPLKKCTQIISIKNKTAKQNLSMKETQQI
jgi:hypothetical protein